jgi:pyridoxal biosynthesis lyase PdxS
MVFLQARIAEEAGACAVMWVHIVINAFFSTDLEMVGLLSVFRQISVLREV